MKTFIGTKIVNAFPESKGPMPGGEDGYAVIYEDGYRSWSPKAQFDAAYRETSGLTFGLAIEALKKGAKVARAGWNGKGMWLSLVTNWNGNLTPDAEQFQLLNFIAMRTAQADIVPWLASQTDMLAEDWQISE